MDPAESKAKFKQADTLYREGQYQQALHLLGELNEAYPNTKNVLYPAALCLEKLGRGDEALPLCEALIEKFQDPRARELKEKIQQATAQPAENPYGLDFSSLDDSAIQGDLLDIPATTHQYKPVEPEPIPWMKYSLIGLGVVAVLALVIVPVLMYEPPAEPVPTEGGARQVTAMGRGAIYASAFAMLLIVSAFQTVGAYIALMLMRSLPFRDFWSNILNISISMVVATLLESSFFGFILTIFWFVKAYDLGFLGIVLFYVFRIVFFLVGFFIGLAVFLGTTGLVFKDLLGG